MNWLLLLVTTWATANMRVAPKEIPSSGLAQHAVRQIVHTSVGGDGLILTLSNQYSDSTLDIRSVYVARTHYSCPQIEASSVQYITFSGKRDAHIWGESSLTSDRVNMTIYPNELLSITINYGRVPTHITGHPGSRTTSYIVAGEATPQTDFTQALQQVGWYTIASIDTDNANAEAIPVLGNSITDGRGSTTNAQNRWTDIASQALQDQQIGLINMGIGGNAVVKGGLGATGRERFVSDILECRGAKRLIVFEGINDISGSKDDEATYTALTKQYARFVRRGHEENKQVYGCTLLPFVGYSHATPERETLRTRINDYIRHQGGFDQVIDLDSLMRDPSQPTRLRPQWHDGDWLHPNAEGYRVMGEYIAQCIKNGTHTPSLKEKLGQYMSIGCAVNTQTVQLPNSQSHQLVLNHFNSLVAENCMKPECLAPQPNEYHWDDADALVNMGEQNHMQVFGHCLIWYAQTPDWFFVDAKGKTVSRSVLLKRMKTYIHTVVGRYKGRIKGWDVVNEAFMEDGSLRDSPWRQIIGDDYIEWAFRYAQEADPDAELYYNDYSMAETAKYTAVANMVRTLKKKNIRIDAVGMQSHNGMDWPNLEQYSIAMDTLAATGVKIIISELDLNVLPHPDDFHGAAINQHYDYTPELDPYAAGMDDITQQRIFDRWMQLFRVYYAHRNQIQRITFWGVSDRESWMNNWPIQGRHAFATLFDRNYQPKSVIQEILKLYE